MWAGLLYVHHQKKKEDIYYLLTIKEDIFYSPLKNIKVHKQK
jgi:hypothetical protein